MTDDGGKLENDKSWIWRNHWKLLIFGEMFPSFNMTGLHQVTWMATMNEESQIWISGLPWFAICPIKESTFSSESTAAKVPDAKLQDSVLKAPNMC